MEEKLEATKKNPRENASEDYIYLNLSAAEESGFEGLLELENQGTE